LRSYWLQAPDESNAASFCAKAVQRYYKNLK
jgi:hypothetical protein